MQENTTSVLQSAYKAAQDASFYLDTDDSFLRLNRSWDKLMDEFVELERAHKDQHPKEEVAAEIGDVFICLIKFAWTKGINVDEALESVALKLNKRFAYMKENAVMSLSREERLRLFKEAKQFE